MCICIHQDSSQGGYRCPVCLTFGLCLDSACNYLYTVERASLRKRVGLLETGLALCTIAIFHDFFVKYDGLRGAWCTDMLHEPQAESRGDPLSSVNATVDPHCFFSPFSSPDNWTENSQQLNFKKDDDDRAIMCSPTYTEMSSKHVQGTLRT